MAEVTPERDEWMRRYGPLYPALVVLWRLTAFPKPPGLRPTSDDLTRGAIYFPAIGALIGLLLAGLAELLQVVHLVPALAALIVVVVAAASTRAMHEVGLMATVAAWNDKRDSSSSTGVSGSESITVVVGVLVAVLALRTFSLISTNTEAWLGALVVSQAGARHAMVLFFAIALQSDEGRPRSESAGIAAMGPLSWSALAGASAIVVGLAALLAGWQGCAVVVVAIGLTAGAGWIATRRNTSVNDSALATVACMCEIAILLGFAAVHAAAENSPWTIS